MEAHSEKGRDSPGTDIERAPSEVSVSKESEGGNQFSSRWAFWLSAIGCSVGFGNVWRFPFLVYKYGGAAFFIPYLLIIFFVTIPISALEFGLGQLGRGGQTKAFRMIHHRAATIGFGCLVAFNILNYYPLLLSWSLIYFGNSFKSELPWMAAKSTVASCAAIVSQVPCAAQQGCIWNALEVKCLADPVIQAVSFFNNELSAHPDYSGMKSFNLKVFGTEVVTWVAVFAGTVGGAKILGYLNYVITTAPAIFLIVLVGVGASLKGSASGMKVYIGKFDFGSLANASVWVAAAGQTLFSLGCTQGTMAAYAAHNKRDQNFVQDTYVVAFGDTLFAFIAGFAVFSVLGYVSTVNNIPIQDLPISGRGLAFQAFPVGLGAGIPAPGSNILSALFFLTLWLLGMSTCVGLIEALGMVMWDSRAVSTRPKIKRWYLYGGVCGALLLIGVIYSTNMGVHLLDCADEFINNLGYISIAFYEVAAAGWLSAFELYKERCGSVAVYVHMLTWIGGAFITGILTFSLPTSVGPYMLIPGLLIMFGGIVVGYFLTKKADHNGVPYTWSKRLYYLTFYNLNILRTIMNDAACQNTIWRLPRLWLVLVKYLIPVVMIFLFTSVICSRESIFDLPREKLPEYPYPYPWWVFFLGCIGTFILIAGMIIFFAFPQTMKWLCPEEEKEFDWHDDELAERKKKITKQVESMRKVYSSDPKKGDDSLGTSPHGGKTASSTSSSSSSTSSSSDTEEIRVGYAVEAKEDQS